MSIAKILLMSLLNPRTCLWVDVLLIKETEKAILIEFDSRKHWLPKIWIIRIKRNKVRAGHCEQRISIKISEQHWTMKFQ